jgi:choline dehydrogenase
MLSKLKKVDYIIVGNGTSGAVLARKLTDDYKTSVIVLEAGVNHNNDPIVQTSNWSPYINA